MTVLKACHVPVASSHTYTLNILKFQSVRACTTPADKDHPCCSKVLTYTVTCDVYPCVAITSVWRNFAGTCNLAADPTPPVTSNQCAAAAIDWIGDAGKAALAYNYTAPTCNYESKPADYLAK